MLGSFNEEAQAVWDFVRCQRADGTFYGTSGTCRKGTKTGAKEKEPAKGRKSKVKEALTKATPKQKKALKEKLTKVKQEKETKKKESPPVSKEAYMAIVKELRAAMGKKNWDKVEKLQKELRKMAADMKSPEEKEEDKLIKSMEKRRAKAPPVNNLSERGKQAVRTYTDDDPPVYKEMNKCVRSGKTCSKENQKRIAELDEALKELPRNEAGGSHFRGVNASGETLKTIMSLKPGDSFSDSGFGSYSRNVHKARDFAGSAKVREGGQKPVIFESRSKELRGVERNSRVRNEQEAILPRDTQQTVRDVREVNGTIYITVD